MAKIRPWTRNDVRTLKTLARQRIKTTAIARKLGRRVGASVASVDPTNKRQLFSLPATDPWCRRLIYIFFQQTKWPHAKGTGLYCWCGTI
jgi:hypothetical protein